MSPSFADPSEEDLDAFIDGQLGAELRDRVQMFLAGHPEAAARVDARRRQNHALRDMADPALHEPVPDRLTAILRQTAATGSSSHDARSPAGPGSGRPFLAKWFGTVGAALAAGTVIGWFANDLGRPDRSLLDPYLEQAVLSHRLFESSGHFEPAQGENGIIAIDKSKKPFPIPIRAPTLQIAGMTPVMVRHVESGAGNAVHIAYQDTGKHWTSLYVKQHSTDESLPFRFDQRDGYSILYWLDGPLVYALVGTDGEEALRGIAEAVYRSPALSSLQPPTGDADEGAPVAPAVSE